MLMLVKRFVFVFTFSSCCCNKLSVFLLLWWCICPRMIVKHQSKPGLCKQHWLRGSDFKTKPNHLISSHCSARLLSGCNVTSICSVVCQKKKKKKKKWKQSSSQIRGRQGWPSGGEAGCCRFSASTSSAYITLSKALNIKTAPGVSVLQATVCSDDRHVWGTVCACD